MAAGLLAFGCGTEQPTAGPVADPSFSSEPTPTPSLTGFPLALGLDDENGDDHSPVVVAGRPATQAFELCSVRAWDPHAGTTDVLGVEWRGEAEWSRGRTLVLHETAEAAAAAVAAAREAVAGCPTEPADGDYGSAHTLLGVSLGDESVAWADTYWFSSDGKKLSDTGLTVYHVVRVGRAVLLTYEYGEGNGSESKTRPRPCSVESGSSTPSRSRRRTRTPLSSCSCEKPAPHTNRARLPVESPTTNRGSEEIAARNSMQGSPNCHQRRR